MDLVEFLGECFPGKERRLIAPGRGKLSILSLDEREVFEEERDRSEMVGLPGLLLEDLLGATRKLAFLEHACADYWREPKYHAKTPRDSLPPQRSGSFSATILQFSNSSILQFFNSSILQFFSATVHFCCDYFIGPQ